VAHHGKMVRVSRSAEAIPLLVPNDALRRDEARAGAGPARGRRGAGEHSGSRSVLVATLLLSVSGAVMYAASSSLAAEERADMRARINDARAVSRASFLPETLLPSTSASVNAELRRMTAQAGDLGAFADATEGTRADATSEPAGAFRAAGASCSCACCVGSACELEALTAALGARSAVGGDEAGETGHPEAAKSHETRSRAVVRSFDAGSPAACDAEACRARFADACPKHASAGIVSARFHAESAPGASARTAFESFETSMVGAVFDEAAATQTPFEDVYAPPSADDVRRAEEWVRDATMKAHAAEAAITDTVGAVAEASGLTPEQIEESAARAEAEQAAEDAAEAAATEQYPAQAPEEAAQAPEEAAQEAAQAPEEAAEAAQAPEEAAQAPEEAAQKPRRLPRKPRRRPRKPRRKPRRLPRKRRRLPRNRRRKLRRLLRKRRRLPRNQRRKLRRRPRNRRRKRRRLPRKPRRLPRKRRRRTRRSHPKRPWSLRRTRRTRRPLPLPRTLAPPRVSVGSSAGTRKRREISRLSARTRRKTPSAARWCGT